MGRGAVGVGINKSLPEGDKRHILSYSGAKVLVTDSSLAAQVDARRGDTPDLAHVWMVDDAARDGGWTAAFADAADAIAPLHAIAPFAPAAILYTSGTNGVPKGVFHSKNKLIVLPAAAFAHGLMKTAPRRGARTRVR